MAAPENFVTVSRRPPDIEDYIVLLKIFLNKYETDQTYPLILDF